MTKRRRRQPVEAVERQERSLEKSIERVIWWTALCKGRRLTPQEEERCREIVREFAARPNVSGDPLQMDFTESQNG